jgi:hypothetical protein
MPRFYRNRAVKPRSSVWGYKARGVSRMIGFYATISLIQLGKRLHEESYQSSTAASCSGHQRPDPTADDRRKPENPD